jgi:hypothetical protein
MLINELGELGGVVALVDELVDCMGGLMVMVMVVIMVPGEVVEVTIYQVFQATREELVQGEGGILGALDLFLNRGTKVNVRSGDPFLEVTRRPTRENGS